MIMNTFYYEKLAKERMSEISKEYKSISYQNAAKEKNSSSSFTRLLKSIVLVN